MESQDKQNGTGEPRVEVFGEEVRPVRGRRAGKVIVLGVILLVVGALLLLSNLGLLPAEFWRLFWPVLFILIGARFVLGNSLAARIILVLVVVALFVFVLLYDSRIAGGVSLPQGMSLP